MPEVAESKAKPLLSTTMHGGRSQQVSFRESVIEQILATVNAGDCKLSFWGYNSECFVIISKLLEYGLPHESIVCVVDPRHNLMGQPIHHLKVISPAMLQSFDFDVLVITTDQAKEEALVGFASAYSGTPRIILGGMDHLAFADPGFDEIMLTCLVKSYATGYSNSLIHLYQAIQYLGSLNVNGDVAEFGICKGGTVVFIKKALEKFGLERSQVFGFDIFEGFPEKKSALDLYRHPKCEFKDYDTVVDYCGRFGIQVVKGDICQTYKILEGRSLILTFFDTDNYSPVHAALELCAEQTVKGGVIFFDHYVTDSDYLYTIGERLAAKEVLSSDKFFNPYGTGLFIKI